MNLFIKIECRIIEYLVSTMARKERRQFTLEVLDSFCKEHNIIYDAISDDVNINRDTRITGLCLTINCESKFTKSFSNLIDIGGAYCTECAKERGKEKKKRTNMEKFGVEHCFQSKELRQKATESCLKKYGVEHPAQSEDVKQKIIDTNTKRYGGHPTQTKDVQDKKNKTVKEKYGVENPSQSEEIKQKKVKTCLINHGVENPSQSEKLKQKKVATSIENYGVPYPSQSDEIKNKINTTNMERYGGHPFKLEEFKQKAVDTCIQIHGVPYGMQSSLVQEKAKQTNMDVRGVSYPMQCHIVREKSKQYYRDNYGVESCMHVPEIADKCSKSAFTKKDYTLPSGKILQIQGYEHFALDECVTIYQEDDIINGMPNVPEIWYNDEDGKKHRHYVDLFIPSKLLCIEVKSTWTAEKKKDNIFLKQKAGKALGYQYEIWVYDAKGNIVETFK